MATKENLKDQEALQQEKIEATVSKAEQFLRENKKTIWGIIIGILVIGFAVVAYQQFIAKPKKAEALEQMYPAEAAFRNGEFELALNGDDNNPGFIEIIDNYGSKAGSIVYFYAGICALQSKDYESAVSYLKKYNGKDAILAARALSCLGDAYVGTGDLAAALKEFEKAAAKADNMFAAEYMVKAATVAEELGDTAKALSLYKTVKDKYPNSIEGYDIDKYIQRIESAE